MAIHETAIIDPEARIDASAEIGPYVIIEGPVRIGARTRVRPHAFINGWTEIGEECDLHPFTVVGNLPQDFHYGGERSYCSIGNRVVIREGATVHRGTQPESETRIDDGCLLMAYCHVGHNCLLSRDVKIYNNVLLAGHVEIEESAIISASSMVHQFVRLGKFAFIAAGARITMDVPPFMMAFGESTIVQHNAIGMKRAGYSTEELAELRSAYRQLFRTRGKFSASVEDFAARARTNAGRELVQFLKAETKRGISVGGKHHRGLR